MFHLIDCGVPGKSIIMYSKVTLANLDMKTVAWDISQWNYSAPGRPFVPAVII